MSTRMMKIAVTGALVVGTLIPYRSGAYAKNGDTEVSTNPSNSTITARSVGYVSGAGGGSGGSGPSCTWTALPNGGGVGDGSNGESRLDGQRDGSNGTEVLWLKFNCSDGSPSEFVYVAPMDPAAIRQRLYDEVTKQIPEPSIAMSPPADVGGFVRVQNWLAIDPAAPISASASVGPFSVTITATQDSLDWSMGDGAEVTCEGAGSPLPGGVDDLIEVSGQAECGHTFEHVSAPRFTGTGDLAYHNEVTSNWAITWNDYTGASGTLGDISRTLPWTFQVRQIQTQRTAGG